MNPSLLLGIVIGMGAVLVCFGIFLAIPAKRTSKANLSFNERSLEHLTEWNAIGERQLIELSDIATALHGDRRERIAVAFCAGLISDQDINEETVIRRGISAADALIAELDKSETEPTP